jgi:hypothetical protein
MPNDLQDFARKVRELVDINLLYGKAERLDKINYQLSENGTTVAVNKTNYLAVAQAVAERRIIVMHDIPPGNVAAYDNERDILHVDFNQVKTDRDQSAVVHECTHALLDLMKAVNFTMLTSEVAAFLSQTIYLKNMGQPLPNDDKDAEYNRIFVEADLLAQKWGLYGGNGATLNRPDFQTLRTTIQKVYLQYGAEQRINGIGVK